MTQGRTVATDLIQPFQVEGAGQAEGLGLSGRLVRLGPVLDEILGRHGYPAPVAALLGEAVVLTALLASTLKHDGIFTLQASGDGPVGLVVADQAENGALRGYARFDAEALAAIAPLESMPLSALLGRGTLSFTADPGQGRERHQGIVPLEGASLTACTDHFFRQSEQLDVVLVSALDGVSGPCWSAGAILVQRLPGEGPLAETRPWNADDAWDETVALVRTARPGELTDPSLLPRDLLYRLFHQQGMRIFAPRGLAAGCRCSRERVLRSLAIFPEAEIRALARSGEVETRCEFCGETYVIALETLYP